ncbi:hypothetical protein R3P38DRAFT_3299420 [Favolaschia claudopus]|uniref:Uncharacterized protein n=1 Tax=Favolaschia claudopus TaxID=2862362 RepID=A0AAV9Z0T2_9AGAR
MSSASSSLYGTTDPEPSLDAHNIHGQVDGDNMVSASIEDDPDVSNEFLAFVHNFSGPKDWFKHKRQKGWAIPQFKPAENDW